MKANLLTAKRVGTILKNREYGWHHDGGGLYLVGSKKYESFSWTLRIYRSTVTGRARDLGLGSARLFTLSEAREKSRKCRQLAADGIDPIEEKRKRQDEAKAKSLERITFKEAATRFIALHAPTWKNEKHRTQWSNTLRDYAYHTLCSRPVSEIDGRTITEALAPIWMTKVETARRVKQRIERVVQWVKDGMPLPQHGASKRVKHHAAMSPAEIPAFMADLRKRNSISARALEFVILTVARTGEAIGARWDEINLKAGVWTIPAGRMKGGKEHDIPLSRRALAILRDLPREGHHIFIGSRPGQGLSNMALLELLRGMRDGLTVHGFRSTFRDWAGDQTHFAREVIEHALAHHVKDKAEAAYRRGSALEKRRLLMEAWAKYCSMPAHHSSEVVSLRA